MPRKIAAHGVYMPTLMLLFVIVAALTQGLDRIFAPLGLYCFTWHPTLLRVSPLVCLYGGLSLTIHR